MKVAGIVAEYDPFHLGHRHHIEETKKQVGETAVVCVMSGSWTQRGACSLTDKWTRAGLALQGGVDLVLELPVWRALSSAEGFALGAVELLEASGVVDWLSFGSECGNTEDLECLSACLDTEACQKRLRELLREGKPFAKCRQEAAGELLGEELAGQLSFPNNNLGVEYIRAIHRLKSGIQPVTVARKGAGHNEKAPEGGFASASCLRDLTRREAWKDVAVWTLPGTVEALRKAGVADIRYGERAILARLRSMGEEEFARLPDSGAGEGLPARLFRAARKADSLKAFYDLAKTKRYPYARLRRLAVRAFLGMEEMGREQKPAYLRVLGMNGRGMEVLKEMKQVSYLPVLTKPAHIKRLEREAARQFDMECRATDLYGLCFKNARPCGLDYTAGPVVITDR